MLADDEFQLGPERSQADQSAAIDILLKAVDRESSSQLCKLSADRASNEVEIHSRALLCER
jgi:hypothetical protein